LDGVRDGNLELGKRDKERVGLEREGRNECSFMPLASLLRWLPVEVPGLHSFPGASDRGQLFFFWLLGRELLVPSTTALSAPSGGWDRRTRPLEKRSSKGQAHFGKDPRMTTVGF